MTIYSIYKATNKISGKSYIGFTVNLASRKRAHFYFAFHKKQNSAFYNALRKHGWDTFEWEILYQSEDRANCISVMELFYIEKYRTYIGFSDCNGYNMTLGGEGTFGAIHKPRSKEYREQRRKIMLEISSKWTFRAHAKNRFWWNNGEKEILSSKHPGDNWVKGRIIQVWNKGKTTGNWWTNGVDSIISTESPGSEWKLGRLNPSLKGKVPHNKGKPAPKKECPCCNSMIAAPHLGRHIKKYHNQI